jgi:hypothetical protein
MIQLVITPRPLAPRLLGQNLIPQIRFGPNDPVAVSFSRRPKETAVPAIFLWIA